MPNVRIRTAVTANTGERISARMPSREILHRIVQPVPSPRIARPFEQTVRVAERRGIVHRLAMLAHLAHELALVTRSIQQMPDAPEPGAIMCDSRMAVMASAIRW